MRFPRFVRRITDPLLRNVPVPILSGVNRGRRWSLVSAGAGYGTGRRAAPQMHIIALLLREGDIFWDVGAHHGFVVLCASPRVGSAGQVHAFEPSATNRARLRRHVDWNRLANVTVHPYALSSYDGESNFGGNQSSKAYSLGGGDETVTVHTARALIASGAVPAPTIAKIDIEDAEADLLEGALDALRPDTRLIIAIHSRRSYSECIPLLEGAGYSMVESTILARQRAGEWKHDPDLVCFGPAYEHRESDRQMLLNAGF